jgi:hypothetical protein
MGRHGIMVQPVGINKKKVKKILQKKKLLSRHFAASVEAQLQLQAGDVEMTA